MRLTFGACSAILLLSLVELAGAAPVRGVVHFPDEAHAGTARSLGYWRVPNGVLPVTPPLHDVRAEAVVLLIPQGTVTGAQVAAAEEQAKKGAPRAELQLVGLRLNPPVSVLPPGSTVTLTNDDRVPHHVICPERPTLLPKEPIPPGGKIRFTLDRPGEYSLRSEDYAHLRGALLVIERGASGRVEPSGAFAFDAPEGHYQARLYFRGAYQATLTVDVEPKTGAEVNFPGLFTPLVPRSVPKNGPAGAPARSGPAQ